MSYNGEDRADARMRHCQHGVTGTRQRPAQQDSQQSQGHGDKVEDGQHDEIDQRRDQRKPAEYQRSQRKQASQQSQLNEKNLP